MTVTDFPMLRGLDPTARARLLAASTVRRFDTREVVFHEGDPGDVLHLVASGRLAVRATTPLGNVATLQLLGVGDAFGELALLDPAARRTASVVTLEPTRTLTLTAGAVAGLRRSHPTIDRFLTAMLAAHVKRLSAMLVESLYLPADTRVARRLADLAELYDGDVRLTQDDVASLAGTTRATANGVLRRLERQGALALSRGRIRILDRSAVARAAR